MAIYNDLIYAMVPTDANGLVEIYKTDQACSNRYTKLVTN